jgi:hypothetical protein
MFECISVKQHNMPLAKKNPHVSCRRHNVPLAEKNALLQAQSTADLMQTWMCMHFDATVTQK